jgi:HEPN domain-containing protein
MKDPASQYSAWVAKAEEDRLCIANNLAAARVPWSVVCFHAQQAAEKYLKALLVSRGVRVERTHDLEYLLDACLPLSPALGAVLPDCQTLSAYAVDARYPDVMEDDVKALASQAVAASDRVCAAVARELPTT